MVPPNVAACWLSHQAIFELISKSDRSHAVIFEDDALPKKDFSYFWEFLNNTDLSQYDFLQFGYLANTFFLDNGENKLKVNFKHNVLKTFGFITKNHLRKVQITSGKIQPGTHAYLISKGFATKLLGFNIPVFLAADLAFMKLGDTKLYRMYRTTFSFVEQSESNSDIIIRSKRG